MTVLPVVPVAVNQKAVAPLEIQNFCTKKITHPLVQLVLQQYLKEISYKSPPFFDDTPSF
ncbi:hypothetical protein XYCOK13_08790 [Xylanibacillus composti]|uniref:Uncharacterized protein n=1 Tax=Xylanibacillus composti TaxID=1572762 RepID=A0A8J4M0R1_9BACL|nr:hypothetical protein XYCOK13_08790 [Xylanibacillus composti]